MFRSELVATRLPFVVLATTALLLAGCNCGPAPANNDGGTGALTVGGTLTGLVGNGLVLQNNGGDPLSLNSNGSFTFATALTAGAAYSVTVQTQPSSPAQVCTVTNGSGIMGDAAVTNVSVICVTSSYDIGGVVAGLAGTGLVLQNNGGDDLTVSANGAFTFATRVPSLGAYAVTVLTQPSNPPQVCTVTDGSGTVGTADVTNVAVTCVTVGFPVGGTVSGLSGTGLVLQNNAGDNLTVTADGAFTFSTPVPSGSNYAVTVLTQPTSPSQTCVVTNGTGTVGTAAVTTVTVTCTTNSFAVGGTVTGLATGESVVLQNNGGDDLTVSADGAFAFSTSILSGATYAVTVLTNPAAPIAQTCTVTGGTGTVGAADVSSVVVTCVPNPYLVGGTVTGLAGTGLVLQNNAGDDLTINADGTFTFSMPVASGATYAVTVLTQPTAPWQTCVVTNDTGTITNVDVSSVVVTCTTNVYAVGGTVSGLSGAGLVLQNNAGDNLAVSADGSFTFGTPVASGAAYAVTVLTQPSGPTQTCAVTNGTGTVTNGVVTSVTVTCTTNSYTIGGRVLGLTGTGLVLRNNGGDDLTITSAGAFTFSTPVLSGATYAVTVATQPTGPTQTCVVVGGTGTVGGSNVTSVTVSCDMTWSTSLFPITVSGASWGLGDLCFDANGDLLLTVSGSPNRIVRVNRTTGAQTTVATGISGTQLLGLTYRAANDMIYVSNSSNQIYSVTSTGTYTLLATVTGTLNAITIAPAGFGSYGGYIIGATNSGTVVAVEPTTGAITTIATGAGALSDLAFAPNGTLYVVGTTTVRTVTATGTVATFYTGFSQADGITIAADGSRMFVTDWSPDLVYQLTIPGAVRTTIGSYDIDDGFYVGGILADPGNTVIVRTGENTLTLRAFSW